MRHVRTKRMSAGAVVMALIGSVLTFLLMPPAQANHGSLKLEVYREIASAQVGSGFLDPGITYTAILMQSNGAPPVSGGANVEIDWEVETGAPDVDGVTPATPDNQCTTSVATTGEYPSCTATFKSATAGTTFVRAWIDHDGLGENEGGGTEADRTEGRLSGDVTDCSTEAPEPAGIRTGSTDRDELSACQSTSDGAATPGRDAERDETDVVRASFFDPASPLRLDCPELTLAPTGGSASVRCIVSDANGQLRPSQKVDAKHFIGANDPNGGGPAGDTTADYQSTGVSAADGVVFIDIDDRGQGETGFALVCVWIDSDSDTDTGLPGNNPSYNIDGTSADGGDCDTETDTVDADTAGNTTDFIRVKWEDPVLTTLDVTPETGGATVGATHTVTAKAFDQFGRSWPSATVVNFEFLAGSPGDTDNSSSLASPDKSCTTSGADGAEKTCSFSYSATTSGTDTICGWFGAAPSATCDGESQSTDTNARADVVTFVWTASATTTTTSPPPPPTTTTAPTTPPAENAAASQGYTLVGSDGGIFTYGTSKFHGSTGDLRLNQPVIGLANKANGTGYWLVAKDGGIFTFGDAGFFGSTGDLKLNAPVLGMEATPSGQGYYLFAADGGIFTFGDAKFFGSTGDLKLNAPAVGLAINEKGDGYWLVAQDGGIFSFGNVPFHGSTGDLKLNQPVFDMAPTAGDKGYYLVAKDGGIFSFGDAENKFFGSAVGATNSPVIGIGTTPTFNGYWISDAAGAVFPFGDARFLGDRRGLTNNGTIVGFATVPKK